MLGESQSRPVTPRASGPDDAKRGTFLRGDRLRHRAPREDPPTISEAPNERRCPMTQLQVTAPEQAAKPPSGGLTSDVVDTLVAGWQASGQPDTLAVLERFPQLR